jgi:tetratricopeptide (TPR) repeat protein
MEAVILESLALIESAAGNLGAAGRYFHQSAECERARDDFPAMAAALSNYAHMLIVHDREGAERLLKRALSVALPGTLYYAVAADNMASELERQGRHDEAVEWSSGSVDAFRAINDQHELFIALRNLARHLGNASRRAESAQTFEEAHDLIHGLRRSEVDEEHYAAYPERVAAIEAHTSELFSAEGAWLTIALTAELAERLLEEGIEHLEEGRLNEAVDALTRARDHWLKLEASHCIVRANYHLAYALVEIGDNRRALELAHEVRAMANSLGDAQREAMALSLLIRPRLRRLTPAADALDYLAQARALDGLVARQLGLDAPEAASWDGGSLSALAALICADAKAYGIAVRYMDESVAQGRNLSGQLRYRLAYRLLNLYRMLGRSGESDRATHVFEELREVASSQNDDPRAARVLSQATVRQAFMRGDRSAETLAGLLDECAAYETLRDQARGAGPLVGFPEAVDPPFEEAAEVALALDRPRWALALLERGKARALLDAVGLQLPALPPLLDADPEIPAIDDALGLELFVTSTGICVLAIDGGSGSVTCTKVVHVESDVRELANLLQLLVGVADSERAANAGHGPLDAVLADPTFQELSRVLVSGALTDRSTWLAPHGFLHQAPLQLSPSVAGSAAAAPWSIVPALSLAHALPPPRIHRPNRVVVACGDPLGDLPFARAEARLVAKGSGHLALGSECEPDWLQKRSAGEEVSVLHLACHGRFDRGHPERCGLVLAAPAPEHFAGTSGARLMKVDQVAELRLEGVVVVLSACSSGLEVIRDGDEATGLVSALLRARASAIIAAQWPISDLSAMLFMVHFYEQLRSKDTVADLRAPLEAARGWLASLSAIELCARGFELAEELVELDGSRDEALAVAAGCLHTALSMMGDTGSAEAVAEVVRKQCCGPEDPLALLRALSPGKSDRSEIQPFAGASHWGAFTIVGRSH